MQVEVIEGYKFRLDPTRTQAAALVQAAGCARWIYNWALGQKNAIYQATKELPDEERFEALDRASRFAQDRQLPILKEQFPWLNNPPSHSLQAALHHLDKAFKKFFKKTAGYPEFKRKGHHDSFTETDKACFKWNGQAILLPKIGWVNYRKSRKIAGQPKSVTIVKEGEHWYASITTKQVLEVDVPAGPPIAYDLGVAISIATSEREALHLPVMTKEEEKFLASLQRAVARKEKGSKRRQKAVKRFARFHACITNRVNDARNRFTTDLAKNHCIVIGENLPVCNMTRSAKGTAENPGSNVKQKAKLNKVITRQGWGMTQRQLDYKCRKHGGVHIKVNPRGSSQRCPHCQHQDAENRRSQALFLCANCGYTENADFNATDNLKEEGLRAAAQLGIYLKAA
jgi:putative transposase